MVHESASTDSGLPAEVAGLPKVSLGALSAHELATPLGTVLAFDNGGVSIVVGGSMTSGDAEEAARAFA